MLEEVVGDFEKMIVWKKAANGGEEEIPEP